VKLEYDPNYEGCFVCGKVNPQGMQLCFSYDEKNDVVFTVCKFSRYMQGFEGIVHGGFISMLLDEVMAKACLQKNIPAVTAKFNVRFKKPVWVEEEITVRGRVAEIHGKKIKTEALCVDIEGSERASAHALFIQTF